MLKHKQHVLMEDPCNLNVPFGVSYTDMLSITVAETRRTATLPFAHSLTANATH